MKKSAIASPTPTSPPDPRTVTQRLRKTLSGRKAWAQTCGWENALSGVPKQCHGEVCAFDSARELWGCCPPAYLSKPCILPPTCIDYSVFVSPCTTGNECSWASYPDALACSDPQTPYCATSSYDSTGVMMTSYGCTTYRSTGLPIRYFYSIAPSVAGVLADQMTITPSGFTSLATVMVRTFAVASLPDSTSSPSAPSSTVSPSVSVTASTTSTIATSSSTHSSTTRLSTPTFIGIFVAVEIVILMLALGAWYYLRRRNLNGSGLNTPSSQSSTEQPPSAIPSSPDLIQHAGPYTKFLGSPSSVHPNDSASRIAQSQAPSKGALQKHDDRFAPKPHGLKGGTSPVQAIPSDASQPCCTQPSF